MDGRERAKNGKFYKIRINGSAALRVGGFQKHVYIPEALR